MGELNMASLSRCICILAVGLSVAVCGEARAATMTFNGITTTAITVDSPASYSENGITIQPSSPAAGVAPGDVVHFDVYANILGGTDPDNVAAIHTGNVGEQVTFTYLGGSAFDFLSIDITGWQIAPGDPLGVPDAKFTSSNGTTYTVTNGSTGVIDFSSMVGWSNILWFTFAMPIQSSGQSFICGNNPVNCTIVAFDDVTVSAAASAVPLPAALPLFATGLGVMGLLGWRKKRTTKAAA
jgi:hypothetical protein